MDYETLSAARKDLVMVTLTGDRQGRPQVDYTVNPALGIPNITGPEGSDAPVANALPAWDLIAGNMCVSALLAAERHRLRKGAGQEVEIALKDVAAAAVGHLGMIGDATLNPQDRRKSGNALYGAYGQDFVCADGRRVMVIGLTARQWRGLIRATGIQPGIDALERRLGVSLMDEGARWRYRHKITDLLRPWFASRPVDAFRADFDKAGLTWSEFRSIRQALHEDPDLSEDNPMFSMLDQPGLGRFAVPGHPAQFGAAPRTRPEPAPALGSHTEEVLSTIAGMDDTEIAGLFDAGVVASPTYNAHRDAA
jgi:2-methylfumaryl-CoA isomerase